MPPVTEHHWIEASVEAFRFIVEVAAAPSCVALIFLDGQSLAERVVGKSVPQASDSSFSGLWLWSAPIALGEDAAPSVIVLEVAVLFASISMPPVTCVVLIGVCCDALS